MPAPLRFRSYALNSYKMSIANIIVTSKMSLMSLADTRIRGGVCLLFCSQTGRLPTWGIEERLPDLGGIEEMKYSGRIKASKVLITAYWHTGYTIGLDWFRFDYTRRGDSDTVKNSVVFSVQVKPWQASIYVQNSSSLSWWCRLRCDILD